MSTRREFIKQTALLTAGTMLVADKSFGINLLKKKKVIILGAGLSGLAAGKMLTDNGYEVQILEARNRIGGRVFSYTIDEPDNLVIELGGEWVGDSHERLLALCKEMNVELINNRFEDRLIYNNKFYGADDWDYSPEWKVKFDKIKEDYKTMTEEQKRRLDKVDWWRFLMNNGIPERDLDIREYSDSTDFGESIRFVPANGALAEYSESSAYNEMDKKAKGGNKKIAEALAERIGADKIFLNNQAASVSYGNRIKVVCANGNVYEGDFLICALPTYSMGKISWNPALPQFKADALNELQYARINKCATLFKEKFWQDEAFSIITDTYSHYFYHATKSQNPQKGVLLSYSVGDKADILSRLPEDQKMKTIAESLKTAFGDVSDKIERSVNYYWGTDNYSKGAYAFYGKGQFDLMDTLREKLKNVYFSGEHIAYWQGFMEGAVDTGEIAAKDIMGA